MPEHMSVCDSARQKSTTRRPKHNTILVLVSLAARGSRVCKRKGEAARQWMSQLAVRSSPTGGNCDRPSASSLPLFNSAVFGLSTSYGHQDMQMSFRSSSMVANMHTAVQQCMLFQSFTTMGAIMWPVNIVRRVVE